MRAELRKFTAGEIDLILIYGGIAFIAVIASRFVPILELFPPCLFKAYFGISCPTCGSTRSLVHFSHGEFTAAFAMNPLLTLVFFFLIGVFFYRLLVRMMCGRALMIVVSEREQRIFVTGIIILALLNWVYLIISL